MGSTTTLALFGCIAGFAGLGALIDIGHMQHTKGGAFEEAKELAQGKGIINIGAGPRRSFGAQEIATESEVLVNVDIALDGMPNFIQLDVEREPLPFADKQFGCAFASHVLEHLDNWEFCLSEASRVADYVVVVLPHPSSISGWLAPEHRQHFSVDDIDAILELYPNLVIYY